MHSTRTATRSGARAMLEMKMSVSVSISVSAGHVCVWGGYGYAQYKCHCWARDIFIRNETRLGSIAGGRSAAGLRVGVGVGVGVGVDLAGVVQRQGGRPHAPHC